MIFYKVSHCLNKKKLAEYLKIIIILNSFYNTTTDLIEIKIQFWVSISILSRDIVLLEEELGWIDRWVWKEKRWKECDEHTRAGLSLPREQLLYNLCSSSLDWNSKHNQACDDRDWNTDIDR